MAVKFFHQNRYPFVTQRPESGPSSCSRLEVHLGSLQQVGKTSSFWVKEESGLQTLHGNPTPCGVRSEICIPSHALDTLNSLSHGLRCIRRARGAKRAHFWGEDHVVLFGVKDSAERQGCARPCVFQGVVCVCVCVCVCDIVFLLCVCTPCVCV